MKKNHPLHFGILLVGLVLGALVLTFIIRSQVVQSKDTGFHEHADFALFLNGSPFDFSEDRYMSIEPCTISQNNLIPSAYAHGADLETEKEGLKDAVHLHNNKGGTIHVHQAGITYEDFFNSLGMEFHDTIFVDADGNTFAQNTEKEFSFMINGEKVNTIENKEIRDLDRVLISYVDRNRNMNDLMWEYGHISNDACINSEVCPHREPAEPEKCGSQESKSFLLRMIGL